MHGVESSNGGGCFCSNHCRSSRLVASCLSTRLGHPAYAPPSRSVGSARSVDDHASSHVIVKPHQLAGASLPWAGSRSRRQKQQQKLAAFCCSTRTGLPCRHRRQNILYSSSLRQACHAMPSLAASLPILSRVPTHTPPSHALPTLIPPSSSPASYPYSVTSRRCCATSDRESSRLESHVHAHLTSIVALALQSCDTGKSLNILVVCCFFLPSALLGALAEGSLYCWQLAGLA